MSKKWILAICLIASAQAKSNELSSLVDASIALRQTFANGIIAVGGMMESAPNGGIPGNDILAKKDAYITSQKQLAYNSAIQAMQAGSFTNMGAQDFFEQQASDQMDQLNDAVDNYVDAATALIEVATLSNLAEQNQDSPDDSGALEVQNYINDNQESVVLTDEEVESYNQSMDDIASIAQQAASFFAVANDENLISEANSAAAEYTASYGDAGDAFFDNATGIVSVDFESYNMNVMLDVNSYFMQDAEIMSVGAESVFYYTSPQGGCWFSEDQEACLSELGVYGP